MDSFLDVCMICFLEGAEAVAESRRPRGRVSEWVTFAAVFLLFATQSDPVDLAFSWHPTSVTFTSSPGSVHFLSVGKCSLYHLEKEAPAIRMHSGVRVKRVPKEGIAMWLWDLSHGF